MQSAYASESSSYSVAVASIFTIRPLLPALGPYPHNALLPFALPYLSISEVQSTSIARIALLHRRRLL